MGILPQPPTPIDPREGGGFNPPFGPGGFIPLPPGFVPVGGGAGPGAIPSIEIVDKPRMVNDTNIITKSSIVKYGNDGKITSNGWREVDANYNLINGKQYRLTLWVRMPDSFKTPAINAVRGMTSLFNRIESSLAEHLLGLQVTKVEAGATESNVVNGRVGVWPLRITFDKNSGGTPFILIAGGIVAIVVVSVWGFSVIGKVFEEKVADPLQDVFSPGMLVAGLLGIYLITKARK